MHITLKKIIIYTLYLIIGFWLIFQTQSITTWDQGDYGRVITSILSGPADGGEYRHWEKPTMVWRFREPLDSIFHVENFAAIYFNVHAHFQRIFSDTFSLFLVSIISKLILLVSLLFLSKNIAENIQIKAFGVFVVWCFLSCVFFLPYNIYLLNSFYQEHLFWLGLPILLAGVISSRKHEATILLLLGVFICGLSKHQFFYIPALVMISIVAWRKYSGSILSSPLILGLIVAQILCIYSLIANNPLRSQYYYQATYYGSYVLASTDLLKKLKVPRETIRCIGSDRWGVQLAGKNGDEEGGVIKDCYDEVSLHTSDVILPYAYDPMLLWRMWRYSRSALWTAEPFHNVRRLPYVISPEGFGHPIRTAKLLSYFSNLRERYLTQNVEGVSLFAIALACYLMFKSSLGRLPLLILFIVSLIWSQIAIALIGEGFRDLGKHFAAAQLCYDLLIVILLITLIALMKKILTIKSKR